MKYNEVIDKYENEEVNLSVRMLDNNEASPMVLIEGHPIALKMLAELLHAAVDEEKNGGFSLSPTGAGSYYFSEAAEMGLYIHCIRE